MRRYVPRAIVLAVVPGAAVPGSGVTTGFFCTSGRNDHALARHRSRCCCMSESVTPRKSTKDGVLAQIKNVADLPSPDTRRWVPRRKAIIVDAVRQGAISLEEVCRRYQLSVEEFLIWQRAIETHGMPGLRVTRVQIYRDAPPTRPRSSGTTERPAAGNRRSR